MYEEMKNSLKKYNVSVTLAFTMLSKLDINAMVYYFFNISFNYNYDDVFLIVTLIYIY